MNEEIYSELFIDDSVKIPTWIKCEYQPNHIRFDLWLNVLGGYIEAFPYGVDPNKIKRINE